MLKHVVIWKIKEEALGLKKWELEAELKFRLEGLVGRVPEIKYFQVGLSHLKSEFSGDMVLVSDFEDADALKRYAEHPEHLKVADYAKQIVLERRVVDFEYL